MITIPELVLQSDPFKVAEPKIRLRDLEIVVEQGHIEEWGNLEVGYIGIVPPIHPYTIIRTRSRWAVII